MLASPGFTGEGLGLILGDRQGTVIATLEPTGVRWPTRNVGRGQLRRAPAGCRGVMFLNSTSAPR
jgi:hypothetical protein